MTVYVDLIHYLKFYNYLLVKNFILCFFFLFWFKNNFGIGTLHAQMSQGQRLKALEKFHKLPNSLIIATDVASRGLDVQNIQYVIHYQLSRSPDIYVHRSGRTARVIFFF